MVGAQPERPMRDYQRKQLPFEMVLRGRQRWGNKCAMLLGLHDQFGSPSREIARARRAGGSCDVLFRSANDEGGVPQ